jgi:hypothetical protein
MIEFIKRFWFYGELRRCKLLKFKLITRKFHKDSLKSRDSKELNLKSYES